MIRAYAGEQGVGDVCTFTGRVSDEDLCRILSSADVAVDPDPKTDWSDQSTMNKIMEYMFFGLPIVCYDLTEHRVSAQDAALYVEANSERALAEGIGGLLGRQRSPCADVGVRGGAGPHEAGVAALGPAAAGRLRRDLRAGAGPSEDRSGAPSRRLPA